MYHSTPIRILASANNEYGDLFTRLTSDLFFAMGYDDLRFNIHKSGREIDIQGKHRFEPRRVICECKAHNSPMGGDQLNKFFGVLNRERKKCSPCSVAGYFVSLNGFTETGIEQEIETGDDRVILLSSEQIVNELERSRVIIDKSQATERAGQCVQYSGIQNVNLDGIELLGHSHGYIWVIFYARGKERTHFALIHADGSPLAEVVAKEIINADRLCGGELNVLKYLAPPISAQDRIETIQHVLGQYRQWLSEECGYILLDGLPADTDLSATRLKLERLFVPLKTILTPKDEEHRVTKKNFRVARFSIGKMLEKTAHLALLSMPGGGKSTLLKRLATAYAFPERREVISDNLPNRDWLPLILRCRELRDRAHRPILELIDDVPRHAGMNAGECTAFRNLIHDKLRNGTILLLIDGLDEISEEGARQAFANHLRTFIAMFPQTALVLTSREAGFRLVAGVVAGACDQVRLAPLNEQDVLNLCERWHVEVVGDSEKVRNEAKELGQSIWNNEHIRTLTENPLLLTTLLIVKRCIGELPRNRTTLYKEAIRVLVRTWNVEGYAPLDEDEALAQLSYVACAMMAEGKQQIGKKALLKLLQNARKELEVELQFARISPQEFIERIEYRSSLLIQTGHAIIEGELQPIFEFRHLTFQEYLTARGYVEEQYPGRDSGQTLAELLEPHFGDEHWGEVIPMSAVLAGRKAEELMKRLVSVCERQNSDETLPSVEKQHLFLLHQCIRDEVQITPITLRAALRELARARGIIRIEVEPEWVITILQGKFGAVFQEVIENYYLEGGPKFDEYIQALEHLTLYAIFRGKEPVLSEELVSALLTAFQKGNRLDRIRAALACMNLAYSYNSEIHQNLSGVQLSTRFQLLSDELITMLDMKDMPSSLVASWALAWMGEHRLLPNLPKTEMLLNLYNIWRNLQNGEQARYLAWAFSAQRLLPRDTFNKNVWGDCDKFLRAAFTEGDYGKTANRLCALAVGWYRQSPWSDAELADIINKFESDYLRSDPTVIELLSNLGDKGKHIIAEWERKNTAFKIRLRKHKKQ